MPDTVLCNGGITSTDRPGYHKGYSPGRVRIGSDGIVLDSAAGSTTNQKQTATTIMKHVQKYTQMASRIKSGQKFSTHPKDALMEAGCIEYPKVLNMGDIVIDTMGDPSKDFHIFTNITDEGNWRESRGIPMSLAVVFPVPKDTDTHVEMYLTHLDNSADANDPDKYLENAGFKKFTGPQDICAGDILVPMREPDTAYLLCSGDYEQIAKWMEIQEADGFAGDVLVFPKRSI